MSRGGSGLWQTTNGGANWTQLAIGVVTTANQVGVGMAAPGQTYPAIFVGGTVGGQNGFFRSDDQGATWIEISDLAHQYGWVTVIQGDPRVYGRLYVGTNGRGILYADIHTPQTALPSGWSTQDVGAPGSAGSAGSPYSGTWELIGGGAGITGTADAFRFAYTSLTGDGSITAQVMSVPSDSPSNHNAKAGVMIRDGVGAGAANVLLAMSPGSVNGAFFQYRSTSGGATTPSTYAGIWSPYWVRLTRSGNTFTAYCSADGVAWTLVGAATVAMGSTVDIGLAVTASDNNQLDISTFQNVTVITPTHTWDGGSLVNNLWSTPENWVGDVAPSAGDNLIFPAGAAQLVNDDDYPSTTVFGSITVSGSGYHFQNNDSTSASVQVQSGAQLEVDNLVAGTLTIGSGATLTIAPIPGGPTAANSALTPLATDALPPNQPDTVTQATAANTIAPSSSTVSAIAAGPLADSTVLAAPAPAYSEAASTPASPDSLSNTVLDAVAAPAGIIADTALPVALVESTPARITDMDFNRLPPQSPLYLRPDSTALHKIIESGLEQPLTTRYENITSAPIFGSLRDELPSRAEKIDKHPITPAINSRQAHIAALQTIVKNSLPTDAGAELDFDVVQHVRAGKKHVKQLEKAVDTVLAEEDAFPALL
jgi:hypothetical protein